MDPYVIKLSGWPASALVLLGCPLMIPRYEIYKTSIIHTLAEGLITVALVGSAIHALEIG